MKHLITTLALSIASLTYAQDQWNFSKMVNYKLEPGESGKYYATDTMTCDCKIILKEGDYGRIFLSIYYVPELSSNFLITDFIQSDKSYKMTLKHTITNKQQGIVIKEDGTKAELYSSSYKSKAVFIP